MYQHYTNELFREQEEADLPYEEEILRNPYSVKCWLRYIEHKKDAPKNVLNMVYERALKELPGRYVSAIRVKSHRTSTSRCQIAENPSWGNIVYIKCAIDQSLHLYTAISSPLLKALYTSPPDSSVHSDTNSTSLGSIQPHWNLLYKN